MKQQVVECTDKTVQDAKTEGAQTNATNAETTDAVITLFQAGKYCQMVSCCGNKLTVQAMIAPQGLQLMLST